MKITAAVHFFFTILFGTLLLHVALSLGAADSIRHLPALARQHQFLFLVKFPHELLADWQWAVSGRAEARKRVKNILKAP